MRAAQLIFRELFGFLVNRHNDHNADRMYFGLVDEYEKPGRNSYHGLDHMEEVVVYLYQHRAFRPKEEGGMGLTETQKWACIAAGFWHDIYNPRLDEAVKISADICGTELLGLVVYDYFGPVHDVGVMAPAIIRATDSHESDDLLSQLVIDADLQRFASPNFRIHSAQIREEYADVDQEIYDKGRKMVLMRFLVRDPFFYHDTRRSQIAVNNIVAGLRELKDA